MAFFFVFGFARTNSTYDVQTMLIVFPLNLQEPVSHVVARPSPNDILEWRKCIQIFIFFCRISLNPQCYKLKIISLKIIGLCCYICFSLYAYEIRSYLDIQAFCVTTSPQLCRYCSLWGPQPSQFCSLPKHTATGENASLH